MASVTGEPFAGAADGEPAADEAGRVSFLEQALWQQFGEARAADAFARAWLALQCTLIAGVAKGVVVLGEAESGPFAPVAYWPSRQAEGGGLAAAAEAALKERRGVAPREEPEGASGRRRLPWAVAYPFLVDGRLFGVAAIELDPGWRGELRPVMRQLQWGVGWIEAMLRREQLRRDAARSQRLALAFELAASALEQPRFRDACNAATTELAMRLDCERVSVGFVRRRRVVVAAVSHTAQFGKRMRLIRAIGGAMDEAVDQQAMVLSPPPGDWEYRIERAHRELRQETGSGAVLTIPLHAGGRFFGALSFERRPGADFDEEGVLLCDCVAGVIGPILEEKRANDRLVVVKLAESLWTQLKRLFGPRYFGRKLATVLAVLVVAFFWFFRVDYAVTSRAALEGRVQRSLVAPFEGYIAAQYARAGDIVHKDEVLARLDDHDLEEERLKWITKRQQQLTEYDKALAKGERAEAKIDQALVAQAQAQIALLNTQIARTRITAPFDGLIISGDLSQSVGAAVKRGDQLFQIAPLASYRVILKVDERDIAEIKRGQTGSLILSSLPLHPLHYVVTRVTPIAEAKEGATYFRVDAALEGSSARLRPGMQGIGKTAIGRRLLIRVWTQRLVDWVRLTLWKWWP